MIVAQSSPTHSPPMYNITVFIPLCVSYGCYGQYNLQFRILTFGAVWPMLCCCSVKLTKTNKTILFMTSWNKISRLIMLPVSSLDQIIPTFKCCENCNKWSLFVWTVDLDLLLTCLVNDSLALGHVLKYWIIKFSLWQLCINASRWILVILFAEHLQL